MDVANLMIFLWWSKFHTEEFALVVFGEDAGLPLPDGLKFTGGAGVVNVKTVVSLDSKIDFVSFHKNYIWKLNANCADFADCARQEEIDFREIRIISAIRIV